jgi:NMD protein affecting ribosome stability and mRNA decay
MTDPGVRTPVSGRCRLCGEEQLQRYVVLSVGGWFEVVKCQVCLYSQDRQPWHRLGWVTLAEDAG